VMDRADAPSNAVPWEGSPVPEKPQIRGFYSVTLAVDSFGQTAEILTDVLGYDHEATEGDRRRYRASGSGPGSIVDLVETDAGRGRMGVGTVHHVAFTAEDVEEQHAYREAYREKGLSPSEVIDRKYFNAIYTREPNGILFEIATTGPGFDEDEDIDELGTSLTLPEWLEDEREQIEAQLPEFDGPNVPSDD